MKSRGSKAAGYPRHHYETSSTCRREHQHMVLDRLKQALKKDRTKTIVVDAGPGSSRDQEEVRGDLSSIMLVECPHCDWERLAASHPTRTIEIRQTGRKSIRRTWVNMWKSQR